jgi:hypothetical protein
MIARPVATATTAGTANPVISILEDITALIMSFLAILVPALAFLLILVMAFVMYRIIRGIIRRRAAMRRE